MIITDTLSHLLALVLDSERENPLFRAPIEKDPKHILDIGTGKGNWAMYVKREKPPPHRQDSHRYTACIVMLPTCSHLVSANPRSSARQ